ncbi:Branched-chain amino acid aminotransferase II [Cordyceps fumosorosea ARSEF 2679]|uniref:Branched-chain-amino-acid aminotransferase n=1 Tax=Cordyceps fumosorosea (strain ARSEF 2679) TaxID=1081104 RepID=A0A167PM60_CORFA|nr:Branched-chain amino acid aminotransferase II [Cordyceps fumosorosea ARSEF 2679]OAA56809.1 Branched-chain amino acid aminotransferase II [Cordyceps fumosorosea ARSEF 2679]
MSPSAVKAQDVNLTAAAVERKEAAAAAETTPVLAQLDASRLTYTYTQNPRAVPDEAVANAGTETIATDHMVLASWSAASGWSAPELKPYGPLSLMPTASCLHYATECFEGLKVFRGHDGGLRVFRPDRNCARMNMSAGRISLPTFPPAELQKLIMALLEVDGPRWLPRDQPGRFLYLRPTLIGTQSQLGVQAPREALLYVIVTYMPRMDSPPGGMRLHTSPEDMVRAWVGGFGYAKVGANYGPSLLATADARRRGYHQILWLYGPNGECTEAGASNFFVLWKRKSDGKKELITAPLDDKLILDGVTRRSAVELARERLAGEVEVTERKYTIDELVEADAEGRILESFAAGTAYFICPVSQIHHRDQDINIPMGPEGKAGEVTTKIKTWIGDIMYGNVSHKWGVVVNEKAQ